MDHLHTKQELFSLCGKLVAHYPIAGWLRLACSFVKRHSKVEKWDDYIGDRTQAMIEEQTEQIISELAQVFYERGSVAQVLMDNASSFRSEAFMNFLAKWNVQPFFRPTGQEEMA